MNILSHFCWFKLLKKSLIWTFIIWNFSLLSLSFQLKQICSSFSTSSWCSSLLAIVRTKRQGNGNMICWLFSPVIQDHLVPQGVPLSSESHFQLWLCLSLDLQGCNTNQPWLTLRALRRKLWFFFSICFNSTIHILTSSMSQTKAGCVLVVLLSPSS